MRHVVPIVEQLSRAAEELASDHPVHHRLGYILVDNAAELIVHRFAGNLALKAKSWLAGPLRLTPRQMRQARTGKFDDRLGVIVAAGVLTAEEKRFSSILHGYRNRIYHAGLRHEEVVQALGGAYYRWTCELFARLPPLAYSISSDEKPTERAKFILDAIREEEGGVWMPRVERVAPRLAGVAPKTPPVRTLLQAVAVEAIEDVRRAIDFVRSDAPRRPTSSEVVRDAQVNMEIQRRLEREDLDGTFLRTDTVRYARWNAIVDETRATFEPSVDKVPFASWRARAAAIGKAACQWTAITRYQDLRDAMSPLEEALSESAFQLDMWLQEQSDIARGK